jgi:pimeloyl-ACP methyl ester carboxylesterase
MAPSVSKFFTSQRLRLHWTEWGAPDAPPLLLIHGVRDHGRNWDRTAERLSDRWRVIAPDLRGHGDSEWANSGGYSSEAYVFDLAELIAREGLAPLTIIGHSLGGNIGLRYAGLYPEHVRRIVAIEGLSHSPRMLEDQRKIPTEQRLRRWIEDQREIVARPPRRYSSLAEAATRVKQQIPALSEDQSTHLARHGLRATDDGGFQFKFDPALRVFPPVELPAEDAWRLWSLIVCPTLLIYGGSSWASNPVDDGRAAHFRFAEIVTLEGAGHWVHHDRFEAFMALVERFLAA